MRKHALILALPATLWLALACPAQAQWTNDPVNGMVSVCDAPNNQTGPLALPLAGGRTLIAWQDERSAPDNYQIYYQILTPAGEPLMPANGVPLIEGDWKTTWGYTTRTNLFPDLAGGCIAIFNDYRSGYQQIYGQRLDSLGNRLWGDSGLPLAIWPGAEGIGLKDAGMDSSGNIFIAWIRNTTPTNEMYMQKITLDGQRLWGDYGAMTCGGVSLADYQQAIPDGLGGALDLWMDTRHGSVLNEHLFVQHLNATGQPLLTINGIPVLNMQGQSVSVWSIMQGVADGRGGGFWLFSTPGVSVSGSHLFHMNGRGQTLWWYQFPNISAHSGVDLLLHPVLGTLWAVDADNHAGYAESYLYHFTLQGHPIFQARPFGSVNSAAMTPTHDGVITLRAEDQTVGSSTIIACRVTADGSLRWRSRVALGHGPAFWYPTSASDGQNGAVVVWQDMRFSGIWVYDIYAQRVNADGSLGGTGLAPAAGWPETSPAILGLSSRSFRLGRSGQIQLELYDLLGRRIAVIEQGVKAAGEYPVVWPELSLPSGIYLLRLRCGGQTATVKVSMLK